MILEFRSTERTVAGHVPVTVATDPRFARFQSKANWSQDAQGVHMLCAGGAGTGFMWQEAHTSGLWQCRMRISDNGHYPSTKVCLLLWEMGGNWQRDHHEIDYNESGDRTRSNQTVHYGADNLMHHTTYPVDQTQWHTYGVQVDDTLVSYFCDGVLKAAVTNESPGVQWVPHFRTQPNLDTEGQTKMDIRWIEVPD